MACLYLVLQAWFLHSQAWAAPYPFGLGNGDGGTDTGFYKVLRADAVGRLGAVSGPDGGLRSVQVYQVLPNKLFLFRRKRRFILMLCI